MIFKTYGSAIDSLKVKLVEASNSDIVIGAKGTPNFFKTINLEIHRTFQTWCSTHGLNPVEFRNALIKLRSRGEVPGVLFDVLILRLPDEFNVRGVWTPED